MRGRKTRRHAPAMLTLLLALTGCVNLDPPANPTRYYVLGRTELGQKQRTETPTLGGYRIGIRRAQVAEYLDTPLIVTRLGTNEVAFAEYHRWGEDVGRGIERALATYLIADPSVRRADVVPWPAGVTPAYVVQINVERFEGEAVGQDGDAKNPYAALGYARFLATWEILDEDDLLLRRGTIDFTQDKWLVGNHQQLVTFLDLGVEQLSKDLLRAIRELAR
ncbi:MAG: PqiC family protein [Rhodothermales bacterium]